MATYTVIQDIEAEDKFLGPLTLKQFIFGAAGCLFIYLSVLAVTKGAAFLVIFFVPPALIGFFLAIPWSSQQSTEVWVLAKVRFLFKPRLRIWDQSGLEELVTVTAPKHEEKQLTNGLDQTEVESRLKALADTIDTRGWAVKNATLNTAYPVGQVGERLIDISTIPKVVPDVDVDAYDDMLSEDTPVSANFDHMIQQSSMLRKQQSLEKLDRIRHGEPLDNIQEPEIHFTPPPQSYQQVFEPNRFTAASPPNQPQAQAAPVYDEALLTQQLRNNRNAGDLANQHMKRYSVYPGAGSLAGQAKRRSERVGQGTAPDEKQAQASVTNKPNPAIVELVDNNDLNISTIARQAKKSTEDDNEVVVSLR